MPKNLEVKKMPDFPADKHPDSPYGVICDDCGSQGLSNEEYDRQMARPNSTWICPQCRGFAQWDDDRYERAIYGETTQDQRETP